MRVMALLLLGAMAQGCGGEQKKDATGGGSGAARSAPNIASPHASASAEGQLEYGHDPGVPDDVEVSVSPPTGPFSNADLSAVRSLASMLEVCAAGGQQLQCIARRYDTIIAQEVPLYTDKDCDKAASPFGGGHGTAKNPYLICAQAHVEAIAGQSSAEFLQTRDIDVSGVNAFPLPALSGAYNGLGFALVGVAIHGDGRGGGAGLFRKVNDRAVIRNLVVRDASVVSGGPEAVGVVTGLNEGTLINVKVLNSHVWLAPGAQSGGRGVAGFVAGSNAGLIRSVEVRGSWMQYPTGTNSGTASGPVGLVAGSNAGVLAYGTVQGSGALTAGWVETLGGVAGLNSGAVRDSSAHVRFLPGQSTVPFTGLAGGIVGANSGEVTAVTSWPFITASNSVGGIAGSNAMGGVITRARVEAYDSTQATTSIEAERNVGGLVGVNVGGAIRGSRAATSVLGTVQAVGGLVGTHLGGEVDLNSVAVPAVVGSGTASQVGGLVGVLGTANSTLGLPNASLSRCSVTGSVGGASQVGGLVGAAFKGAVLSNSFGDTAIGATCPAAGGLVGGVAASNTATISAVYTAQSRFSVSSGCMVGGFTPLAGGSVYNNNYWPEATYRVPSPTAAASTTLSLVSATGTMLNAQQMAVQSSYVGWDFNTIWVWSTVFHRPTLRIP